MMNLLRNHLMKFVLLFVAISFVVLVATDAVAKEVVVTLPQEQREVLERGGFELIAVCLSGKPEELELYWEREALAQQLLSDEVVSEICSWDTCIPVRDQQLFVSATCTRDCNCEYSFFAVSSSEPHPRRPLWVLAFPLELP